MNPELDALLKLLTGRDFTVTGFIIAVFITFAVSLNRNWLVTGPRYKECKDSCDNCNTILGTARDELKRCESDYTNARITIVRYEEREFARQWQPPTLHTNPPPPNAPPNARGS
ncbi:MAG TPA: hypothetical protein VJQ25_00890 [Nitrospira sp.]|nr:hypothetical protein [Nitrospira sp.]